jgi:hypothetical protein
MPNRLKVFAIAGALAAVTSSVAMAQYAPCPPGYALYGGVCQPVPAPAPAPAYPPAPAPAYPSNPVSGAAAGGAAGAAAGEATGGPVGAVVGGALGTAGGALSGTANMLSGGSTPPPAPACGPGFVYYNGACYPR